LDNNNKDLMELNRIDGFTFFLTPIWHIQWPLKKRIEVRDTVVYGCWWFTSTNYVLCCWKFGSL